MMQARPQNRPPPVVRSCASEPSSGAQIGVQVRPVAAGVIRDGKRWKLRVTLSLMPVSADGQAAKATLKDWPADINKLLCDLKVCFSPVVPQGKLRPRPQAEHCEQIQSATTRVAPGPVDGPEHGRLMALWARLIAPDTSHDDQLAQDGQGTWAHMAAVVNKVGQTSEHARKISSDQEVRIAAVPRSDAAIIMSLKRARAALMRLPHANGTGNNDGFGQCDKAQWDEPWMQCFNASPSIGTAHLDTAQPEASAASPEEIREQQIREAFAKIIKKEHDVAGQERVRRSQYLERQAIDDDLFKDMKCVGSNASPPQSIAGAVARQTDEDARKIDDRARNLHAAATLRDQREDGIAPDPHQCGPAKPVANDHEGAAVNRLMAMQAQPGLARLFNFAIDLELDEDADALITKLDHCGALVLNDSSATDWHADDHGSTPPPSAGSTRFVFIGITWAGMRQPDIWSTAKLRLPKSGADPRVQGHFWPCTQEEIELALPREQPLQPEEYRWAVTIRDGVMDLGAHTCEGSPRWDIITLAPIGLESEIHTDCCDLSALSMGGKVAKNCLPTFQTMGLGLVDRSRQQQVVENLATTQHLQRLLKPGANSDASAVKAVVLDAKALTVAHRLDVATPLKALPGRHAWRALHDRDIKLRDPLAPDDPWLDVALGKLLGTYTALTGHARGLAPPSFHAGVATSPTRMRQDLKNNDGKLVAQSSAFAEELLAVWQGDPLGIECQTSQVFVDARYDLALNVIYDLPKAPAPRPPRLRFGWRYRFGLRPVFLGGVSLPIAQAAAVYESALGGDMSLPGMKQEGRRFLRHERVNAPMLTLLQSDISAEHKQGLRDLSSSALAIVRTGLSAGDPHCDTPLAHRVLVVPQVEVEFAGLHGVFDKVKPLRHHNMSAPRDGLTNARFEAERGGFPLLNEDGQAMDDPAKANKGDAVFEVRPHAGIDTVWKRCIPYYPDPAASFMVVAARFRSGRHSWLAGKPQVLDLTKHGLRHPDLPVVLLEVCRLAQHREARQETVLAHDAVSDVGVLQGHGFETRSLSGWRPSHGGVPALRVRVRLAPGEDFDVLSWLAPASNDLFRWFDIVESAALLCLARSSSSSKLTDSLDTDCKRGFVSLCGSGLPKAQQSTCSDKEDAAKPSCGSGGLQLPSHDTLLALACAMHRAMLCRPNPEIAATTVVRVMHAVARPIAPPDSRLPPSWSPRPFGPCAFSLMMSFNKQPG